VGRPAVLRLHDTWPREVRDLPPDRRAQLLVDDSTGFRAVLVPATVEIREDIAAELPRFRAIREKHGMAVPDDDEHLRALTAEGRVLLAITPDEPPSGWTGWGLD